MFQLHHNFFFLKMLKICVSWPILNGGKRERGWPYLWRQIEHLFYFCYVYFEPIFKQVRTVRVVYFIYVFAFNSSVLKIPHFNNVLLKLIFLAATLRCMPIEEYSV